MPRRAPCCFHARHHAIFIDGQRDTPSYRLMPRYDYFPRVYISVTRALIDADHYKRGHQMTKNERTAPPHAAATFRAHAFPYFISHYVLRLRIFFGQAALGTSR